MAMVSSAAPVIRPIRSTSAEGTFIPRSHVIGNEGCSFGMQNWSCREAQSYYANQLAQQMLMDASTLPIRANDIEVR
jgi:hypothetical protein